MSETAKIENRNDVRKLARMSIDTDKGTWRADPGFGSELWLLKKPGRPAGKRPPHSGVCRKTVCGGLWKKAWRSRSEQVFCEAWSTGKNTIAYRVTVTSPEGGSFSVKEVWNAL